MNRAKSVASKEDEEVCSTIEAAKMLGVGVRTVQLWTDNGALRAWKTAGGHRRIALSSVREMLEQQRAAAGPAKPGGKTPGVRLKLMVVEDSRFELDLYRTVINGWGLPIDVTTAGSGVEGLVKIGSSKPDLLVSDLKMPGMDGFDMIRRLKLETEYQHLKVIVISSMTDDEIRERGGLPKDVTVMHKPADFVRLEALIRDQLTIKLSANADAA